ncbi:acyl--CoA ligase family protein [Thermogemmatispora sp.]|uniref:acyl--CoA ligase family protein n=1 Tax=Thermogemmatispora sp. TaxID=1968838 RepID=UPI001D8AA699|nr:acyl--CoA ligase family protein [Thermogemmatispora sp.]MBX5451465.1 long-chain-fatty-acid--CoA ligase [Thermogemmatispora sp.]
MVATTKVYRTELTPVSFLERSALVFPNKVAVVHGERRYTYRQFAERVYRLANQLRATGLRKHDRVAFLSPNAPALLEAHFGVPAAGGILVAINTRLTSKEIDYILKHSGSRFLFADAELLPLVESLELPGVELVRIDDTGQPADPYEQFLAAGSPEPPESWLEDEEETISINYTSGTTGNPKGVMYTYRGAYLNALGEVIETGMSSSSVYLWTLPMFHCNGWCFPWAVTAVGARHVCLRKVDPGLVWDLLEQEGVTHYNGAPTVHIFIVNHPKAHPIERGVTVTVAGAPPSPTLLAQMRRLNMRPIHVYGLTETYGPYTVCEWHEEWSTLPEEEQARLLARQGQGYVVAERARVVDSEMHDVPWDGQTMGEVLMRGNNVAKGYYENPEATEKAFAGGWFHSGDIAVWHPDGYIELRDRAKDIIISGGENISTIEVEQVVARHPAVLECAVIGIPDPTWGERPKAFVTLKPGQSATEQEIIEFCRQHLAHFKCPVAVSFGELPKTSTGKIQKFVLREREWAGREKRIN